MSNLLGDRQTLSVSGTALRQIPERTYNIHMRAGFWNAGIVYIGNTEVNIIGYLRAGDSTKFHNVSPHLIYVWGTAGDDVYWHGDGSA